MEIEHYSRHDTSENANAKCRNSSKTTKTTTTTTITSFTSISTTANNTTTIIIIILSVKVGKNIHFKAFSSKYMLLDSEGLVQKT